MGLNETLNQMRQASAEKIPEEFREIMRRSTLTLQQSGILKGVLRAGAKAPEFELPDADGTLVSSSDLLAQGPLYLAFYRGVW